MGGRGAWGLPADSEALRPGRSAVSQDARNFISAAEFRSDWAHSALAGRAQLCQLPTKINRAITKDWLGCAGERENPRSRVTGEHHMSVSSISSASPPPPPPAPPPSAAAPAAAPDDGAADQGGGQATQSATASSPAPAPGTAPADPLRPPHAHIIPCNPTRPPPHPP